MHSLVSKGDPNEGLPKNLLGTGPAQGWTAALALGIRLEAAREDTCGVFPTFHSIGAPTIGALRALSFTFSTEILDFGLLES
jgi:hypothetical protein